MSEQLLSKKRYTLAVDGGSIKYEIDRATQTATFSVNIEALADQLMHHEDFKSAIMSAVAQQLTGSDATVNLTEAIGETAIKAAIADLVNANTNNNAEWDAAKDVNSLYTAIITTIMSNNPTSATDTSTGKGYTPLIIHGKSAPDDKTIEQYPGAYIYIQHD